MFNNEQLKTALLAFSETHSKEASKAKKIRHLYSTLEHVINEGLSIDLIVDFLNQQDIQITKNNLKVTLYRIRKERGLVKNKGRDYLIENNSIINNTDVAITTINKTPHNITSLQEKEKEKRYHEIKYAISVATTWKEKYIAMGGDPERIKDMGESQILHMYTALQKKFVKEYKPFLKSNEKTSIEAQKIEYQTIKKNYAEAKGWYEKYAALGGDINDLKNISPSEQRQACVVLRMNFSKKYSDEVKGI